MLKPCCLISIENARSKTWEKRNVLAVTPARRLYRPAWPHIPWPWDTVDHRWIQSSAKRKDRPPRFHHRKWVCLHKMTFHLYQFDDQLFTIQLCRFSKRDNNPSGRGRREWIFLRKRLHIGWWSCLPAVWRPSAMLRTFRHSICSRRRRRRGRCDRSCCTAPERATRWRRSRGYYAVERGFERKMPYYSRHWSTIKEGIQWCMKL